MSTEYTNTFTLDALREETIRRYAPVKVELSDGSVVVLKSILKLKQKVRDEVIDLVGSISDIETPEDDEDDELLAEWSEKLCDVIAEVFRRVSTASRKLITELDHEDPEIKAHLHTAVLTKWMGESQLGEAAPSPS